MSYLKDFQNDSKFNFGQIWKLQPGHRDSGCIRPWGDWVLCANVGSKFLVTLGLIFSFHFLERIASERASWAKLPITLGASKAMKVLALNPFQHAWHHWIVNQEVYKSEQCHVACMLRPFVRPRPAWLYHLQRCAVISSLSSNHS
jgi:hypothetical protein